MFLLLVVGVGAIAIGGAVIARHRAGAAADLAALAAAQTIADGGSGCEVAGSVASEMHAELVGCRVSGELVEVTATVSVYLGRWGIGTAEAQARAGPADLLVDPG